MFFHLLSHYLKDTTNQDLVFWRVTFSLQAYFLEICALICDESNEFQLYCCLEITWANSVVHNFIFFRTLNLRSFALHVVAFWTYRTTTVLLYSLCQIKWEAISAAGLTSARIALCKRWLGIPFGVSYLLELWTKQELTDMANQHIKPLKGLQEVWFCFTAYIRCLQLCTYHDTGLDFLESANATVQTSLL